MKKFISLILCLCLVLCGCGSTSGETTPIDTSTSTESVPQIETLSHPTVTETTAPASDYATISETVIFDSGDFKLTAKEIDFSDNYAVKVKVLAENNTNKTVSILGNYFSINGITMYCSFYIELAPGKKANDFIEIRKDDLAYVGIEEIATIQANDTYIYDKEISKKITDFRFCIETSIAEGYQQEIDNSGQAVYSQDGIVIKYRGIVPGTYGGEELEFYIENSSNDSINVHVENVSVNGFMVYGSMVAYAYPGCVTYETLDFSSSDLEENNIETIEEVSLILYGYDTDANRKVWTTSEFTVGRTADDTIPTETILGTDNDIKHSETTPVETENTSSIDYYLEIINNILCENFETVEIDHSDNYITIQLSTTGVASEAEKAINGDEKYINSWGAVVDSQKNLCSVILEKLKYSGFNEVSVTLNLLNDSNKQNILLSVVDGNVIYNVVPTESNTVKQADKIKPSDAKEYTYILNTNSKKFHFPGCSGASRMKESNKSIFTGTRDEVISKGYKSCNICNP